MTPVISTYVGDNASLLIGEVGFYGLERELAKSLGELREGSLRNDEKLRFPQVVR
jgi:hypothetical protein